LFGITVFTLQRINAKSEQATNDYWGQHKEDNDPENKIILFATGYTGHPKGKYAEVSSC
jgi:hypothetical protein